MQSLTLKPWRDNRRAGVRGVAADIHPERSGLYRFCFRVIGGVDALRIPGPTDPQRRDGLWRHTCFEVFVMQADGSYCEFNFSPSTQWAAYRFGGYRRAMTGLTLDGAPQIETTVTPDSLVLEARVGLRGVLQTQGAGRIRVATAAVIERADGGLDYWALAHPAGKPDFHHPDGFIVALPDNGD
jgi:hypothetical protein